MSMADMLPALRAGRVPVYTERHSAVTKGHCHDEPGIRGHSRGESWPFRVVGKPDGTWEVHRNGRKQTMTGMSCKTAHRMAQLLADQLQYMIEVANG